MLIDTERTVGELVAEDYRRASAFKKFGLDFCCGGGAPLREACLRKGIALEAMCKELEAATCNDVTSQQEFDRWELDFLADYILNVHHTYVRSKLPEISDYAKKVSTVHGEHHPETKEIARHFQAIKEELTSHMAKEEQILFPYVKKLLASKRQNIKLSNPPFGTVKNPIHMMEQEHQFAGDEMKEIRLLSNNYEPPQGACNTYRVFYSNLKDFEENLHQHIHLENNILFPKAVLLEESMA